MIGLKFVTPVTVLTDEGLTFIAADLNFRRGGGIGVAVQTPAFSTHGIAAVIGICGGDGIVVIVASFTVKIFGIVVVVFIVIGSIEIVSYKFFVISHKRRRTIIIVVIVFIIVICQLLFWMLMLMLMLMVVLMMIISYKVFIVTPLSTDHVLLFAVAVVVAVVVGSDRRSIVVGRSVVRSQFVAITVTAVSVIVAVAVIVMMKMIAVRIRSGSRSTGSRSRQVIVVNVKGRGGIHLLVVVVIVVVNVVVTAHVRHSRSIRSSSIVVVGLLRSSLPLHCLYCRTSGTGRFASSSCSSSSTWWHSVDWYRTSTPTKTGLYCMVLLLLREYSRWFRSSSVYRTLKMVLVLVFGPLQTKPARQSSGKTQTTATPFCSFFFIIIEEEGGNRRGLRWRTQRWVDIVRLLCYTALLHLYYNNFLGGNCFLYMPSLAGVTGATQANIAAAAGCCCCDDGNDEQDEARPPRGPSRSRAEKSTVQYLILGHSARVLFYNMCSTVQILYCEHYL